MSMREVYTCDVCGEDTTNYVSLNRAHSVISSLYEVGFRFGDNSNYRANVPEKLCGTGHVCHPCLRKEIREYMAASDSNDPEKKISHSFMTQEEVDALMNAAAELRGANG